MLLTETRSIPLSLNDKKATAVTRLCFVVESGTDVRLIDGLARRFALTILTRRIVAGVEISQEPTEPVNIVRGPCSRARFGVAVLSFLWKRRRDFEFVLVQGYGVAALAANLVSLISRSPTAML